MKKVVAIGGGTGLSTLLRGIRDDFDITAVVTMTDDGACSGLLRKDLGILPPGDIRKCIAALSQDESLLIDIFQYRFQNGSDLKGRSLGNLLITALIDLKGNIEEAIEAISRLLSIKGQVLPASLESVDLGIRFDDDHEIIGESEAVKYGRGHQIKKIFLTADIKANPRALKAIEEADVIIVGPGSLYTSVLPNLLIKELNEKVNSSSALKVYISNVSTELGETENYSLKDHIDELGKYGYVPDIILANSKVFPAGSGDGYQFPVIPEKDIKSVLLVDLVREDNYLYHDSKKLGKEISALVKDLEKVKV